MEKTSKKIVLKIKNFIKGNSKEFWILVVILAVGAFLRLYRIDEYMTFLGDEGRDVIVVRRLLVHLDPILVGPGTSIGNMYLGPLYYYMMAPALLFANFSPVGPSIMVALLGVAAIFLLWYVARKWFGSMPALAVAFLYAVSPTAIIFSRSSWNPNIMPFFALLSIWSIWKVWHDKSYGWLLVVGISFAFVLQSHYLGLLLLPVILTLWVLSYKKAKKENNTKKLLKSTLYAAVLFLMLMSPLLIFDARHNFRNFKAMQDFIVSSESSFKGLGEAVMGIFSVYTNMFTRLIAGRNEFVGDVTSVAVIFFAAYSLFRKKVPALKIVFLWAAIGVIGLAFVEREIFDHYMGFLFPVPYLLLAGVFTFFGRDWKAKVLLLTVVVILGVVNLANSPIKSGPGRQLARSQEVSRKVLQEVGGSKFNFAVLAQRNYEDGYRYFLEVAGAQILHANPWDASTITDTLIVVCEMPENECNPTTNPKAEVANFGPSKVDEQWEVGGTIIYKLSHNKL